MRWLGTPRALVASALLGSVAGDAYCEVDVGTASQGLLQTRGEVNRTQLAAAPAAPPEAGKPWPLTTSPALVAYGKHHPLPSGLLQCSCAAVGLLLMVYMALRLKLLVEDYEEKATPRCPPWFCDGQLIIQVGGGIILAWAAVGVFALMWVFDMAVLGETRRLTVEEAIYFCVEIITTVGYGDVSPASQACQVFLAAYSVVGCSIVAVVFSLVFNFCLGNQRQFTPSLAHSAAAAAAARGQASGRRRYAAAARTVWPLLAALASGTAFYASYPGEEKTLWEAFYFSLQTLTTVGFGDVYPVTRGGRAFATVWMLLGVTAAANTIVTLTDAILKYRKELKADNLSKELLLQMSRDGSGKVLKMDFLCYELVRRGICDGDDLSDILELFRQLDHKGAGFLKAEDLGELRPKTSP